MSVLDARQEKPHGLDVAVARTVLNSFEARPKPYKLKVCQPLTNFENMPDGLFKADILRGNEKVWLQEQNYRSNCLAGLVHNLSAHEPPGDKKSIVRRATEQTRHINELSKIYRMLDNSEVKTDLEILALLDQLLGVMHPLFQTIVPEMQLKASLSGLVLTPYRMRALVTLISILALRTVCRSARYRYKGRLSVERARLIGRRRNVSFQINSSLDQCLMRPDIELVLGFAKLLEAEVLFRELPHGEAGIELEFDGDGVRPFKVPAINKKV